MQAILIIITLLLTFACGNDDAAVYEQGEPYVEDDFAPVVDSFLSDCDKHGRGELCRQRMLSLTSIGYGDPGDGNWGYCYGDAVVVVEGLPPALFRLMVYHELGHCVLHLRHAKEYQIMSPKHNLAVNWGDASYWSKATDTLFASLSSPQNIGKR